MKVFYVDFENVKDNGLNGIAKLDAGDVVRIYYSEDANKMTFGTHRRIIESPADFEYVRMDSDMKGVKNALDVRLMDELARRMKEEKNADYYIVSEDGDYDKYIQEKQKRKIRICRITEICKAAQSAGQNRSDSNRNYRKEQETKQKKEQVFRSYFGKHLKNEYGDNKEYILNAYMNASTRQELNNNLQQYFYNEDVGEIMRKLSELTKDMPGR